uniref:glucuronosyltransferase n=1 Tax=Panagrellus redivivus TaxID=6233 RepID=A0A7E4V197_PANRE
MRSSNVMLPLTWLLLGLFLQIDGYKIGILVPDISGSQVTFNQRIGNTLAEAGHTVTLVRLQMLDTKSNGIKLAKNVSEWVLDVKSDNIDFEFMKNSQSAMAFTDSSAWEFLWDKEKQKMFSIMSQAFADSCEKILENTKLMQDLKDAKFDVVFSHMYDLCPLGLQKAINAPTWIWLNSGALMDYVAYYQGLRLQPSYAGPLLLDAGDKLTFAQRVKSEIGHFITPIFVRYLMDNRQTALFRKAYGEDFPRLTDIAKECPLVMVNSNELYDLPRPTLHKIVNIGGIGMKPAKAKPLPKEYADKVEKAQHVVVFSFGSVANATRMPDTWKQAFRTAFLKYSNVQFFIRFEGKDYDGIPNVHTSKWLPQVDLLQHPKTIAFISHGGYNSLQESLVNGVPLVAIPLFGDQFRNGRIAERHGVGIVIPKGEFSSENLVSALSQVITDKSYAENAHRLRDMVFDKPVPVETLLVRWTEFLAKHKTLDNLKPASVHLDFVTLYNFDVYLFLAIIVYLVFYILFVVIRGVYRLVRLIVELVRGEPDSVNGVNAGHVKRD